MTSRDRFLAACHCQPLDRPPVWIMRQAGRYLPEYRALKTKYSFLELVRTPELATMVTLQPLKRFALDAAILFSDILVVPEALGQPYHFRETGGISMDFAVDSADCVTALDADGATERLGYVFDAIRMIKGSLPNNQALLGFSGAPWTLATYMIEGGSSSDFTAAKMLFYSERELFEQLMEKITRAVADYCLAQVEAGVDAIQLFDSWGGALAGSDYENGSLQWIRRIVDAVGDRVPVILYAKGTAAHLASQARTGVRVVSVDWTVDLAEATRSVPSDVALQGNLDPVLLNTEPEIVTAATRNLLESMRGRPGYIVNLGHGILPAAKIENVTALVDTVCSFS